MISLASFKYFSSQFQVCYSIMSKIQCKKFKVQNKWNHQTIPEHLNICKIGLKMCSLYPRMENERWTKRHMSGFSFSDYSGHWPQELDTAEKIRRQKEDQYRISKKMNKIFLKPQHLLVPFSMSSDILQTYHKKGPV